MLDSVAMEPALFDKFSFEKALLKENTNKLALFKQALSRGNNYLKDGYEAGKDIRTLVNQRAWFVDQLLINAWKCIIASPEMSLIAVGGYGRGELHPYSDVDLMILHKTGIKTDLNDLIKSFLRFLWDIGLEVGHSVRTIEQCKHEADQDITVITNLMESRLVDGNEQLYAAMTMMIGPDKTWSDRKFFESKFLEQQKRHKKFADTSDNVEPNIKEGPGGLRDIQVIGWVVKRHFGASRLRELVTHKFLTPEEYRALTGGRELLWRIRFGLHLLAGRREDRLLFEYQKTIARQFGYSGRGNGGVEEFMKRYYTTVRDINRLNEMLLQHFQETIIFAKRKDKIVSINNRFQIRHDFIDVKNKNIFSKYPFAVMEMFLLIQQNPSIRGVRASAIRLVRKQAELIDDEYRNDIRARGYFLEIIRQPRHVGHELRRMHRYGVLGAYLPVFRKIQGLMQFDLFHVYTVDEHTLFVIRNLRLFGLDKYKTQYPLCHEVIKKIPKLEVLYIAGLFHDIAKGRRGDHSELGAKEAVRFCKNHDLSDYDTQLVAWLVKNHLLMSRTSQKQDVDDADVINDFAQKVADQNHLNYLYLLTVADICATNPTLWNNWKAFLLMSLYQNTLRVLRHGLEQPKHRKQRLRQVKRDALQLLGDSENSAERINKFWKTLNADYFLKHSHEEIAWHTTAILNTEADKLPLILVDKETKQGWSQIFIYMQNSAGIFSATTRAIDKLHMNVLDARIITSKNDYTLDSYIVLEADGKPIKNKAGCDKIIAKITNELQAKKGLMTTFQLPPFMLEDRKLKSFKIPTQISFSTDGKNNSTVMEVITMDRPGVLSRIGAAMELSGVQLQGAKISTYGERVEDVFYITTENGDGVDNPATLEELKTSIMESLG